MAKVQKKTYSKYKVDISKAGKEARTVTDYKTGLPVVFDSLLEKQFYEENIVTGMDSGEIVDYEVHKTYQLQPSFKHNGSTIRAITYEADFVVTYKDGSVQVFDTKGGMVDPTAKLKKKMMHYIYPELNYIWVTRTAAGWIDYSTYEKQKRDRKKAKKENK